MFCQITLEPVFFLFCLNAGLINIPSQSLYIKKACQVNLGHNETVCDDIQDYEEVQVETQQLVSEIQAYNGMLQSLPGMVFVMLAGPLTDTAGRKPLILSALLGYLVLDLVFLVNSFWFYQLKVEFLLLECLQDLTGGGPAFYLASYSFMVDITSSQAYHDIKDRTRRLSVLDSFIPIGFLTGLPLGNLIRDRYGYCAVFSVGCMSILLCVIYVLFLVKENKKPKTANEEEGLTVNLNKDFCKSVLGLSMAGFKTIFKKRENNGRTFIICFTTVFILSKAIDCGDKGIQYMFYRLQYKITDTDFSNLYTIVHVLMILSQVAVVPFLSSCLKWRDTTILMLAVSFISTGFFITAFSSQLWLLYLSYGLFMLWNTVTTTCRSNLSKLLDSMEIGRAFTILSLFQGILPFATRPFYAFLYKHSLHIFPAAFRVLTGSLYLLVLAIIIFAHFGLIRIEKREESKEKVEVKKCCSGEGNCELIHSHSNAVEVKQDSASL